MPLAQGRSRAAIGRNIAALLREGRPRKQAIAIAMATAHVPPPGAAMPKKKKHHAKKKHPKKHAKRAKARKRSHAKKHHERRACGLCGHRFAHGKAGCMHISGNKICPCKG